MGVTRRLLRVNGPNLNLRGTRQPEIYGRDTLADVERLTRDAAAERGFEVWGVSSAPAAIEKAKAKARQRGLQVAFEVFDALSLEGLGRSFDTVIDTGLFHVFADEERPRFVRSLGSVLRPGGAYFMMCFSDLHPGTMGPRRVTQGEIRDAFGEGWGIHYIREAIFESTTFGNAAAWLARITRTGVARLA